MPHYIFEVIREISLDTKRYLSDHHASKIIATSIIMAVLSNLHLNKDFGITIYGLISKGILPHVIRFDNPRSIHTGLRIAIDIIEGLHKPSEEMVNTYSFKDMKWLTQNVMFNESSRKRFEHNSDFREAMIEGQESLQEPTWSSVSPSRRNNR